MKTLADAANELGVTKTTVSRALSGKGRVGEKTRRKVLDWVEQNNFTPNSIARSLAERKSYNIAVVLPKNADNLFFQQSLIGIAETIVKEGYDTVTVIDYGDDISSIERIVKNQKVDGVIITRTVENDKILAYLKNTSIPYLVIGTIDDDSIFQVDVDHTQASCDLTRNLLRRGIINIALLAGGKAYPVNKCRYNGFKQAYEMENIPFSEAQIFWDVWTDSDVHAAKILKQLEGKNIQAIACTDSALCQRVINALHRKEIRMPQNLKLFSFYEGKDEIIYFDDSYPVSSVCIDTFELSHASGENMLRILKNQETPYKTVIPYTLKIK